MHSSQYIAMGLLVALLWLTAALVWHDLGVREVLGRDENATAPDEELEYPQQRHNKPQAG